MANLRGVTMIELLIVVALTIILVGASFTIFGGFQSLNQLNDVGNLITQSIRTAKARAIDGLHKSNYGVYFQSDRYILYQGSSYTTREAAYDRETVLGSALSLSTTILNNDLNFSKGLGRPNSTGTISIIHNVSGFRTISVNEFGFVQQ